MIDYKELIKNFTEDDFKLGRVNLHIHTNHSDGEADFDEIIEQANIRGYKYIAITDHNCILGHKNTKYSTLSKNFKSQLLHFAFRIPHSALIYQRTSNHNANGRKGEGVKKSVFF